MPAPPLGGMLPSPWIPCLTNASRLPCLSRRACQATVSPNLGAPISPLPWQAAQILSYSPLASKAGALLPASATAAPPAGAGAPTVSWPTGARRDACNSLSMVMLSSSPPQKKKGRMRNTGIKSAAIVMMILVFCGMSVCAMMMLHFRKFFRNLRCKLSQMRPDGASICAVYQVHFAAFARGYF